MEKNQQTLWIHRLTQYSYLDRLSEAWGLSGYGTYFFVLVTILLSKSSQVLLGPTLPSQEAILMWAFELMGLLLVAHGIVRLSERYGHVVEEVKTNESDMKITSEDLTQIDKTLQKIDSAILWLSWKNKDSWQTTSSPFRIKGFLYAGGLLLHLTFLFVLGGYETVLSDQGIIAGGLNFFIIIPFVYYPLFAELVSIILNVHLGLPSRIRSNQLLQVDDPDGYSGLRPVGELIKSGSFIYISGLLLYAIITAIRTLQVSQAGEYSLAYVDWLYLVIGTLIGIGMFVYPIFALHRIIELQKDSLRGKIVRRIEETENDGRFFPAVNSNDLEATAKYMQEYMNMRVVEDAHSYPVNLQQISSVLVGFVLPYAIDYVIPMLI